MSLEFKEFEPSSKVRGVIKSFFEIDYAENELRKDFLLPNGAPAFFMIRTSSSVDMNIMEVKNNIQIDQGIYIGYISTLAEFTHHKMHVIGAVIYPMYLYPLFEVTPKDLLNKYTRVSPIKKLQKLNENIDDLSISESEFPVLMEQFVLDRLRMMHIRDDVKSLFKKLTGPDGYRLTVEEMAEEVGYTRRHLSDLFNKYLGMSPKQYVKLARFNQGLKLITEMNDGDTYAAVAHQLGYHDQAHFIRDFKSICGKTPSELKKLPESLAYQFRYFK